MIAAPSIRPPSTRADQRWARPRQRALEHRPDLRGCPTRLGGGYLCATSDRPCSPMTCAAVPRGTPDPDTRRHPLPPHRPSGPPGAVGRRQAPGEPDDRAAGVSRSFHVERPGKPRRTRHVIGGGPPDHPDPVRRGPPAFHVERRPRCHGRDATGPIGRTSRLGSIAGQRHPCRVVVRAVPPRTGQRAAPPPVVPRETSTGPACRTMTLPTATRRCCRHRSELGFTWNLRGPVPTASTERAD